MIRYKGFNVWFNDLQNKWIIQEGYTIVKTCNTLRGAKCSITAMIKADYS